MATQAYHIVSHYSPPSEQEPYDELENEATWQVGHSFGKSKRATQPPKFVPPSGLYDEYGRPKVVEDDDEIQIIGEKTGVIGSWYRNLPRSGSGAVTAPATPPPVVNTPAPSATASAPDLTNPSSERYNKGAKRKPDWFISNVLKKQAEASQSTQPSASTSSLNDMLVRAPPPLPDEEKFVPPVWTAIGPSNRGYGMLEKHGWEEGQALGLGMHRVKSEVVTNESKLTSSAATLGGTHEVEDAEVIDLTAEDSTSEESEEDERESADAVSIFSAAKAQKPARTHAASSRLEDGSRALLTPLPTTLKPDRTGIGSKGLTKKKITHTAEAIAIHARFARKAQRQAVHNSGAQTSERGAKGFSRKMRREERARVDLLAYMKS